MLSNTAQKNAARNPNGTRRKNARAGGLGIRGGLGRTGGRHTRPPPQPPLGGGYGGGLSFACYPTARLATEAVMTIDHPKPKPHSSDWNMLCTFFRMMLIGFLRPRLANFFSMANLSPGLKQINKLISKNNNIKEADNSLLFTTRGPLFQRQTKFQKFLSIKLVMPTGSMVWFQKFEKYYFHL